MTHLLPDLGCLSSRTCKALLLLGEELMSFAGCSLADQLQIAVNEQRVQDSC